MTNNDHLPKFNRAFSKAPVVAILRGIEPDEVPVIADAILRAGILIIEIPLNSPHPLKSIERLKSAAGGTRSLAPVRC
jgi:2-dehydro-3-deoxyphosphogalactonate aldolase